MLQEEYSDSLRLILGISCDKTKACLESNVTKACRTSVPSWQSSICNYETCRQL